LTETITVRRIEALQPPANGRIEIRDLVARGLMFRVTAAGTRTWSLYIKVRGRDRRFLIGDYPAISLAQARERAAKLRQEVREGRDPVAERRNTAADEAAARALTVEAVLARYEALHLARLKDGTRRGRTLRAALERHARRPVSELTRADLQAAIDAKAATAPIAANRLKAALSHFANRSRKRGYVASAIGADLDKAVKERPRERILSLAELASAGQSRARE
jgi:hypothetical protein